MTRAILYARVSGDDRRNATSGIDSQLADCRAYCEGKGYQVMGEFYEEPNKNTSGADWLPELERAVSLAHAGGYDVFVVREVDRLARNRFKQMAVEVDLERAGVRVEYVKGQFADTPEGRLLKGMVSEFAEYEREKIKQRTKRGVVNSVRAGNVIVRGASSPLGYSVEKSRGVTSLVINEEEAAIVRQIFHLYTNGGKTLYEIAQWLIAHNVQRPLKARAHKKNTRGERAQWHVNNVGEIIRNETYAGRWYYGKTDCVKDPKTGKVKITPRARGEWLLVEVPAIVSADMWAKAQERLKRNKRERGKNRKHIYQLSGVVRCGQCGLALTGQTMGKHSYYRCNGRASRGYAVNCDMPLVQCQRVDRAVWAWVKHMLTSPNLLQEAFASYQEKATEKVAPLLRMIESSKAHLAELEQAKERLMVAYKAGVLDLDDFAKERARVVKEIGDCRMAIGQLEADVAPNVLTAAEMAALRRFALGVSEGVSLIDNNPLAVQSLYRTLKLGVTVGVEGGNLLIIISCILGSDSVVVDNENVCDKHIRYKLSTVFSLSDNETIMGNFFANVTKQVQPVGTGGV